MYANPVAYVFSCIFVLLAHSAMLANAFFYGNYSDIKDLIILGGAVVALDIVYFIAILFFKQISYAVDFLLILILNMSVIFQSCFGGVHLDIKHYVTCIAALVSCKAGFLICRNYKKLQDKKYIFYIGICILMVMIVLFAGERSMWIKIGSFSVQPSEFIKPLFVLACATSVMDQQKKHKILFVNVVYENIALFAMTAVICLFQWWCRDLGSLPTFVGIYCCGFLLRICYPKAKFSRKKLIFACIILLIFCAVAYKFAPEYVQQRLHVDIWNDKNGDGYQQSRALIGIANGGWFGVGPGKGYLHNIPAYESDIVFSTICEEWGLLYGLMMVCVILIMVAVPLINPPRSYYHATMSTGVCAAFVVQMALNIFGSCNLIPFTGVTIPFVSAGGSSMVVSGFMIGMLIACQSPVFRESASNKIQKEVPAWRWSE